MSGLISASGSPKTVAASSKETPCHLTLSSAFRQCYWMRISQALFPFRFLCATGAEPR